jgi:uncharacterized protein YjbJ (UPF0337 family)
LNLLDGLTSTTAELNVLDGVTSTTTELNFVDGVTSNIQTQLNAKGVGTVSSLSDLSVTSTATELNIMDGVTATAAELNIMDGVTSSAAELNIIDGSATTQATVTLVGTDGIVISDGDVMKQALVSDIATYVSSSSSAATLTTARAIGGVSFDGSANIDLPGVNAAGNQSTTGNAGTATKIASIINSNIVQLTDTQTLTNKTLTSPTITGTGAIAGTFSGDVTGDVTGNVSGTAATVTGAAQSSITSLGTLTALQTDNINFNGNTISSTAGTDLNITPLAGQQIVLDGAIVVDAGVVTGATSITSTAFVGDVTGDVTGNVSGTAATVTGAAQTSITSLGTLTTLTVDNVITNGSTIGHTADTGLMTLADGSVTFTGSTVIATADVNGGAIDAAAIGASSASTGAFTTVTASTSLDVTGSAGVILQNDETITNSTDGTVLITAPTTTVSAALTVTGDLTVTGNDITFGNAETISNSSNGTIAITAPATTISGTLTVSGETDFGDAAITGYSASLQTLSGTSKTLAAADNGTIIVCSSSSAVTITVPVSLPSGFNCMIIQSGSGQVSLSASSTTLNNRNGSATAGQHAIMTLVHLGSNLFVVSGDTTS